MSGKAFTIQGDGARMPFLPDGCIQTVVTSIPYWGLRSYGTAPRVWGGDGRCAHERGNVGNRHRGGLQGKTGQRSDRDTSAQDAVRVVATGRFCIHCNAWQGEYGSEPTPELFVEHTVIVFREVRRVLRDDGTLWLNVGDCYASGGRGGGGSYMAERRDAAWKSRSSANGWRAAPPGLKAKDLVGIPWRVAFALQAEGWYLRDCIIWHKPNPMPSSVTDRTTTAHEYIFLLTKSARYFYDADAIREPITSSGGASFGKQNHIADGTGAASRKLADPAERNNPLRRNKRSVWTISTHSFPGAHFATFPPRLVEPCIKAGTSERGCCRSCGAPWKRVVERQKYGDWKKRDGKPVDVSSIDRGMHSDRFYDEYVQPKTKGWSPTCDCNAGDPVPCKVLDNFSGAGTTIGVARDLGRIGIGVELNHAYCLIALNRLAAGRVLRLPKTQRKPKPPVIESIETAVDLPAIDPSQLSLFAAGTGAA